MLPPFVNVGWLMRHRADVVLVDCRWFPDGRDGRDAYRSGHVPGAVFADVDRDLAAPATPRGGRHPLPSPAAFAASLSRLGIAADDTVVAYDDVGGVFAARLVWMLRTLGQDAALLDGGLAAWPGAREEGDVRRPPVDVAPRPWPEAALADADDAASGRFVTLDARTRERFDGAAHPLDPRPGHVPGAVSAPCGGNLAGGLTRTPAELAGRFRGLGVTDAADVVAYCGSGVTACHNLLALEHAGLGRGRLYPGSWSAYAADPARRVEAGDG